MAAALTNMPSQLLAMELPLQIAQYAHTSWTIREGASLGLVFAMAQTPDGYLWIAGSYGLFRFDGLRFVPWRPPDGQSLTSGPYSLLVSRDGTLWIGTFYGLASWNGREFVRYPQLLGSFVTSLLETRDGTIWLGAIAESGRLCSVRAGLVECFQAEGGFGARVWSLAEDGDGNLWVGSDSGVWRWSPGHPQRFATSGMRVGDLSTTVDGQVLVSLWGSGLRQISGDRLAPYRFRPAASPDQWVADGSVKSNKLLRDRDGGLWIGTEGLGLIHVKDGLADTFSRVQGLSGNIACSLFEDHEGNIWFGSDKGIDRFRKLPVTTLSTQQGLPNEVTKSVLATTDGSVWVATDGGLARWKDGRSSVFKEREGLPDSHVQSLYQDAEGRLWVSTAGGLAYFADGRFVAVDAGPSSEIYSITGDAAGNLWLSGNKGLAHLDRGRFAGNVPWSAFGRRQQAQVIIADRGGLWLSFWEHPGVSYFKDGKVQATYTAAEGVGEGYVSSLRIDAEGALWATTGGGGLTRIKEGRATTLTVANGLPCGTVHWSALDDRGSLWMYAACGLVRVARDDLTAWIADPRHRVSPTLWGGADGVPLLIAAPAFHNPPWAKGSDGKLWFVSGADVQVINPDHMSSNPVPPPVQIESLVADHQSYAVAGRLELPPLVRDIAIEFAALTFADPRSTRFRYQLEGHDTDWQEAVDRRQASYTNLPPGHYRFRVKAANNSGVWNDEGAQFEFSIRPAFYQTLWFRVAGVALLVGLGWLAFHVRLRMRIRRLHREFEATLEGRVAERTRIARDLHDTLLQHFHGLLLQLQAVFNLQPDRPREARQVLANAIDRAAEAIAEGRATVQGLRSAALETNDLGDDLRRLADEIVKEVGSMASASVVVHGDPQEVHPHMREEISRIAAEALRNALRHADAQGVELEIRYEPRQLRVLVRDDGKGMSPEVLRSGKQGHFGLSGMRERAEIVGARLVVRSGEDGTEVEITAPASRTYAKPFRSVT
ncbi:sensor histidine kinase [Ideonella sp. YS5]|uniref:sensor histidine kinase n=1 Tax=Ideonella sp. YS5 TaxID=3453714 RepID=UPI003EEF39FF